MFGILNLSAFILAGILLNLTPGTDTMYILGRSMSNGKKAGIYSALGISAGCLVHTIFAAFGLSVILQESEMAFNIVKYLGATYLIYLGVKAIISSPKNEFDIQKNIANQNNRKIFMSGILTNVLNPKVALFFLAFLPQFIDPNYPNPFISFLILGLVFMTTGTVWCLLLAIFSSKLSQKIRDNYRYKIWLDRLTGVVFIGLGLKLALGEK